MMRVLLDACVLYPTVMREVLIQTASAGLFQPLWSPRICEEWRRAAARHGPSDAVHVEGEIALLNSKWPKASVTPRDGDLARLWLPDPNDIHVLAAAVAGSADGIVTMNAKDFPRQLLAEEGVSRMDPDSFLYGLWQANPDVMEAVIERVKAQAEHLSGQPWQRRALLKKARLPRLGKAVSEPR